MAAAAKHLTPVAVELGGKSPAIFDSLSSARDRKVQLLNLREWCHRIQGSTRYVLFLLHFSFVVLILGLEQVAVERIVGAKWVPCSGQVCIGVDYVLVEEQFAPILVCRTRRTAAKFRRKCVRRNISDVFCPCFW